MEWDYPGRRFALPLGYDRVPLWDGRKGGRSEGNFVDHNPTPLLFFGGVALVDAAGEVEGFAVGGEGGGGDAEADVLVVKAGARFVVEEGSRSARCKPSSLERQIQRAGETGLCGAEGQGSRCALPPSEKVGGNFWNQNGSVNVQLCAQPNPPLQPTIIEIKRVSRTFFKTSLACFLF